MSRSNGMRSQVRSRAAVATAGLLAIGALVAGCGPVLAGSAAVMGDTRITDETLAQQAQAITSALKIEESPKVSSVLLQRLVTQELVNQLAARNNVVVTQGDIDTFLTEQYTKAGGREALQAQLLQAGIPADQIESSAKTTIQVAKLGPALAPDADAKGQQTAVAVAAVKLSDELDTQISPRFGTWDARGLQVAPPPDDLSAPVPVANTGGLSPMPQGGQPGGQSGGQPGQSQP